MADEFLHVSSRVKAAIESGQADSLRTVLDSVKSEWKQDSIAQLLNQAGDGGTMLHLVMRVGNADMVKLLLIHGADPSIVNEEGRTPFQLTSSKQVETAYFSSLFSAVFKQDFVLARRLIASGMDITLQDNRENWNSLLHRAVVSSNIGVIEFLVEHGAELDYVNSQGLTPLHEAALSGDVEVVKLLLRLGANATYPVQGISDLRGKTALDLTSHESQVATILSNCANSEQLVLKDFQSISSPTIEDLTPGNDSAFSMDELGASLPYIRFPVRPVITDTRLHWLWPPPKQMQQLQGPFFLLNQSWNISFVGCTLPLHQILDIWDVHKPQLVSLGINPSIGNVGLNSATSDVSHVTCCVKSRLFPKSESYRLTITANKISITCSDGNALHYALNTLQQLVTLCLEDGHLPALHIEDNPSLRMRAVLLDITAGSRVPLLHCLFSMVDAWQLLKLNQLHLFTRLNHSTASLSWPWPYSKRELLSLDRYCIDRGIELVPALDIHVDSVDLHHLHATISTVKACFPSTNYIHAGPNLTSVLVDGYKLNGQCFGDLSSSVTWLLCANSLREKKVNPNAHLSFILVEYGFQADYNFHEKSELAWQESSALCFCSGTASWDCLSCYPDAASANILHAVQAAVDRGSLGSITATWIDASAISSLHFAWPGWVLQAGLAWNHSVHWDYVQNSLGDLVSLWIMQGSSENQTSIGNAIIELGRLETWLLRQARGDLESDNLLEAAAVPPSLPPREGSLHYQLLIDPDNVDMSRLNMDCVTRVLRHVKKWHKVLSDCKPSPGRSSCSESAVAHAILAADLILLTTRIAKGILSAGSNINCNIGLPAFNQGVISLPTTVRTDLANRLLSLTGRYEELWAQQYQAPSLMLNNVVALLNRATRRLLPFDRTSDVQQL